MLQRWRRLVRRAAPLCSAGVLFQMSGCSADVSNLAAGLAVEVVNSLVTSYVFGAFNLVP